MKGGTMQTEECYSCTKKATRDGYCKEHWLEMDAARDDATYTADDDKDPNEY